jgi:small conductance mechanosensitive channel
MKRRFDRKVLAGLVLLAVVCSGRPTVAQDEPVAEQNPLVAEADAIVARMAERRDEHGKLEADVEAAEGEDVLVLRNQIAQMRLEQVADISALTQNMLAQEEEGLDTSSYRELLAGGLEGFTTWLELRAGELAESIERLRAERESLDPSELMEFERRLGRAETQLDELLNAALDLIESVESIGVAAEDTTQYLAKVLSERAALVAGRLELAETQRAEAQLRSDETPDDAAAEAAVRGAEAKIEAFKATLNATTAAMERLGLETAEYKQILIETTGEITTDVFDTQVALGLVDRGLGSVKDWTIERGPGMVFKFLLFTLVVFGFWLLARVARRITQRAVAAPNLRFSELLKNMISSVVFSVVMIFGVLMGLSQLGFQLGPLLAGLGIAGFIVGFALQDSLSNFAAGAMILAYRPYDVGDLIEAAGVFGRVSHMNLVSTTVLTIDNQTLVVPNGKIWGDVIKNVTAQRTRRVDMVFGISYADDVSHAEEVLKAILKEHAKVLADPEPIVRLHELGDSSVNFIVRPWVETDDYWDVYWDVTREVKMRFDREDISIPFPQRDVHFYREKGAGDGHAASALSLESAAEKRAVHDIGAERPDSDDEDS